MGALKVGLVSEPATKKKDRPVGGLSYDRVEMVSGGAAHQQMPIVGNKAGAGIGIRSPGQPLGDLFISHVGIDDQKLRGPLQLFVCAFLLFKSADALLKQNHLLQRLPISPFQGLLFASAFLLQLGHISARRADRLQHFGGHPFAESGAEQCPGW